MHAKDDLTLSILRMFVGTFSLDATHCIYAVREEIGLRINADKKMLSLQ